MASKGNPDLTRYLGNDVVVETSLNKFFSGVFKGYDEYMNIVMHNLQELDKEKNPINDLIFPTAVLRGQAIITIESKDSIDRK